jgi:hypothetical protein
MAERVLFRCALSGFIPFNEEGQEFFARCKLGEVVELKPTKVRNGNYHRLFFAILKLISDNSEPAHQREGGAAFCQAGERHGGSRH